ncbi:MAG: hypothetical protein ACYTFY_15355 [Planctomycetota bacterium]|jgi:hypothetical protein
MRLYLKTLTGVLFVAVVLSSFSAELQAKAVYDGKGTINIQGKNNTLSSIAADINNAAVFSYNAESRTAVSICSIIIGKDAVLALGEENKKESGETLVINCAAELKKFTRKVYVNRGGRLDLYYSHILGKGSIMPSEKYHQKFEGVVYYYDSDGKIVDSKITESFYGIRTYNTAKPEISGLTIAKAYTTHIRVVKVYGLKLEGVRSVQVESSSELINCDFGNASLNVKPVGKQLMCRAVLRDCVFNAGKVNFPKKGLEAEVVAETSQFFQIINEQDYALTNASLKLTGKCENGSSRNGVFTANAAGEVWINVPVSLIRPEDSKKQLKFINTIEASATGKSADFKALKDNFMPDKKSGWKVVKVSGKGFNCEAAEYKENTQLQQQGQLVNLCPNSGFEIETLKGIPEYWWPRHFFQVKENGLGVLNPIDPELGKDLVYYGISKKEPYAGENCLEIPAGMERLYIRGLRPDIRDKTSYTVSFYARCSKAGETITFQAAAMHTTKFKLTEEWQRYHVIWKGKVPKSGLKRSWFVVHNKGKATVWLDNVQIEEGEKLHEYVEDNFKAAVHN